MIRPVKFSKSSFSHRIAQIWRLRLVQRIVVAFKLFLSYWLFFLSLLYIWNLPKHFALNLFFCLELGLFNSQNGCSGQMFILFFTLKQPLLRNFILKLKCLLWMLNLQTLKVLRNICLFCTFQLTTCIDHLLGFCLRLVRVDTGHFLEKTVLFMSISFVWSLIHMSNLVSVHVRAKVPS